ncbi:alpha/beta hydrolase [Ectobacillus ponti]|uniref:Alpha/beta hydrolase n=1 Tax=Ectobacillus ponti TaxID=2961894 RepID=A0AA41X102_9BACI|nr:alpha/beta hydrolase [Ectobacillus ponti]MCP8966974.1 alpha/beta hydrolase [Ectobacillus ponti]
MRTLWKALGAAVLLLLGIGYFFTNKMMYIKKKTDEEILAREAGVHFDPKELDAQPKEEAWISSPFGYDIHGWYMPGPRPDRIMVFCHGVTVNKWNSVKYSRLFLQRGFSVFLYDHRRHGQSGGSTTSYGYYEKYDLQAVMHWLRQRFGEESVIGIHGESMGAATLLQYAGEVEDGADFYIADCPFSDFYEQLSHRLQVEFKLPEKPLLPLANLILKLRDGYKVQDVSPIRCVRHIQKPVLFIHSQEDDYISCRMTEELYEQKKGPKMLFLPEKGGHALSYAENKEAYEEAVDRFLQQYVL